MIIQGNFFLALCVVVFCVGMKSMLKMMKEKRKEDEERKKK